MGKQSMTEKEKDRKNKGVAQPGHVLGNTPQQKGEKQEGHRKKTNSTNKYFDRQQTQQHPAIPPHKR